MLTIFHILNIIGIKSEINWNKRRGESDAFSEF